MPGKRTSAQVRKSLSHPIVDADGHLLEIGPVLFDYLRQVGGAKACESFLKTESATNELFLLAKHRWHDLTWEQRREARLLPPSWWSFPAKNTLDRATVSLPRLLRSRMDELGIDFSVLYPTVAMGFAAIADEELRRAACRAYNTYAAELFRDCADRMTPAAVIPMVTPQEAIEEMEFAVKQLGLKAVMIGIVRRPIPALAKERPDLAHLAFRLDTLAFESAHDYDPLWAACVRLKVAAVSHSRASGWDSRRSYRNGIFNHLGHFAAAGEALCRSLFMGGVTRRFPTLNFGFLEGGSVWGASLYNSLVAHWEKRNPRSLRENLDPAKINRGMLLRLAKEYGHPKVQAKLGEIEAYLNRPFPPPANLDEWEPCKIKRAGDIHDLFVPRFYFGCEADDEMNGYAYNAKANRFGARLRTVMGSDIGHWDVTDTKDVVAEAHELVERDLMTERDFKDFVFTNAVRLHGGMNRDFFKGTPVEREAAKVLARDA